MTRLLGGTRDAAWRLAVAMGVLGVVGCGGGDDGYNPIQGGTDGGVDAHADARRDAGSDAMHDAMIDGPPDGADLSIAITATPSPVAASATLTYTIDVANLGGLDADSLTVTQRLPSGNVDFQSATGIGWSCIAIGQIVTCTRATLLVGAAPSILVKVTTPPTGATLTTSVDVASKTADPATLNNSATATTTVLTPADLAIAISDSPDPVAAAGTLTYTIGVTNQGPGVATSLVVSDALPSGVSFVSASGTNWSCSASGGTVSCLLPTLAAGASSTITLVVTAPTSGGTVSNTATISASSPDGNAANNSATTTTTVNAAADLSISITDNPDPVLASGQLQYLVDVTNHGPDTASGITVTLALPAGDVAFVSASGTGWTFQQSGQTVTATRATLIAGAAPTITVTVTAPSEATTLNASTSVASTSSDLVAGNNSATVTTTVLSAADLSIALADSPDPVTTGAAYRYTATVTNAGPSVATNLSVATTLPSGASFVSAGGINWTCSALGQQVTCTTPSLAIGVANPIAIDATAPTTDGAVTATATVSAATADPSSSNNTATQTTTVNAPSDLSLALSATPTTAAASSPLTYKIDVTNLGPRDATNLVVTDRLPDGNVAFVSATGIGWTCALAGQIVTCTRPTLLVGAAPSISIQITTPPSNGTLVDQASVTASTDDLDQTNNTASLSTNVYDSANLSIIATETPDPVRVGTNFAYTLAIANDGPTAATAVSVVDTLPSGATFVSASGSGWTCSQSSGTVTCTRPTLASASSAPAITIVATAPSTPGTMSNTATVSSSTSDPSSANNTATTDTLANYFADMSVSLVDTPDPVQGTTNQGCATNDCVTYTISTANAGPDAATGIKVVIALPNNGSFFNTVGSGWVCPAPTGSTITCTRAASLAAGASAPNITLVWKAPSPGGFSIVVAPTVSTTSTDPATSNNAATEDTTVRP